MKKITTPSAVYGPYASVQALADRYRCDGSDLPFTVIGQGTIDEVQDGDFPPPPAPPVAVPEAVSMRQARLALLGAGKLALVDAAIDAQAEPLKSAARIEWEYSNEVQRHNGIVSLMGPALGLTSGQIDALFIAAAKL